MKGTHRQTFDVALVVLTVLATIVVAVDIQGPLRWLLVIPAALLVPGGAIVPALQLDGVIAYVGTSVVLSIAVCTAGATGIAWLGWWHPQILGGVIALAACAGLLHDIRRITAKGLSPAGTAAVSSISARRLRKVS